VSEIYAFRGLDTSQLGHIRHFANLAWQLPNQWDLMKGKGYGQEDFGGYRFQLAYMAYALALTHRHRLPAAPGLFKPIFERLMEKILLPEVWMYWRDVSRGGSIWNGHLAANYREQWDPVARDNIMYSAYVQSMALMYHYLFGDDRYAKLAHLPSASGLISGAARRSDSLTTRNRSMNTFTGKWWRAVTLGWHASPTAYFGSAISRPFSVSACTTWFMVDPSPTR
jgi:Linalool dehydratase/isomerase